MQGTSRTVHVPGRGDDAVLRAERSRSGRSMRLRAEGNDNHTRTVRSGRMRPDEHGDGDREPCAGWRAWAGISAYAQARKADSRSARCSVNRYYCDRTHAQYKLDDGVRSSSIICRSFWRTLRRATTAGTRNSRTENRGTGTAFMLRAAEAYGLEFTVSKERRGSDCGAQATARWSSPPPAARPARLPAAATT